MAENKLARLDLFSYERAQTVFSANHSIPQKFLTRFIWGRKNLDSFV